MATFKDKNIRPQVAGPQLDPIPTYLRRFLQWVLWRFDWNEESQSWAKVPYDPNTLGKAKSDTPATWTNFDEVTRVYQEKKAFFDGVGFVFTEQDDLCGVDFDNCIAEGVIDPAKQSWVEYLDSYTEESVTGTGVHVICRGVSGKGRKDKKTDIEIYDRGRYFTFSGRVWQERNKIGWRQLQIEQLKEAIFPKPIEAKAEPIRLGKSVDELLRMAFASKNGDSIFSLYQGRLDGYQDDDSAADLALCSKLAFWPGGSEALLDEMFRGSRLYRDKWNAKHSSDGRTYGEMTIEKALATCVNFFTPGGNIHASTVDVSGEQPDLGRAAKEIFKVSDLRDKVHELYQKGRTAGELPRWKNLADLYTIKRRQLTLITGIPNVGKTPFVDNLIMDLADRGGWKHAVCSLENQAEEHLSMLLEIFTGEPFSDGPTQRMSIDTVDKTLDWFEDHFVFIVPDESNCTIPHLIELLDEIPERDGVIVDPWNEFEHRRPVGMTETEYASMALTKMRRYERKHDQHWWLVAHPTKLYKDKDGNYPVPTLYDVSGSAHFRNKPDMGIVLWRDVLTEGSPLVVYVQKVKYRWCGRVGQCELYYDMVSGRFYEEPIRGAYFGSQVVRNEDNESGVL